MPDDLSRPEVNVLDELAATVRDELRAAKVALSNALDHVLNAGDALNTAQERVSTNWKSWLRDNCLLGVSTALLYQQLARHRAEIEAEIERIGELSLRAARQLIARPKLSKKKKKPTPELLNAWCAASDAERTHALCEIPLREFLRVIPATWRAELSNRGLHNVQSGTPDTRVSKIFRSALSHIVAADQPETGKPAAQGQENSALTALRTILTVMRGIDRDLHDTEIVFKPRQDGRTKKRAA